MSRQELPPRQAFPVWRRWQGVAPKEVGRRGLGDLDAELLEFSLDLLMVPGILSGQLAGTSRSVSSSIPILRTLLETEAFTE